MTKEKLRRLLEVTAEVRRKGYFECSSTEIEELEALQTEFEAWEPEKERMALTRQEFLEVLFRMGRLMPWEREELEKLKK